MSYIDPTGTLYGGTNDPYQQQLAMMLMSQPQQQQKQNSTFNLPTPPMSLINQFLPGGGAESSLTMPEGWGSGGAGGSSAGGLGGLALPLAYAAMIGIGKGVEAKHPNTPYGKALLGGLGPSISQVMADPKGMGIPTALGLPFLTPFTASKKARETKPEWGGLFGL